MKPDKKWLLLDVPYLAWRAYYTTGQLRHEGVGTGVLFGFFRALKSLQTSMLTKRVAFCFDLGPYKRKELHPPYKANRTFVKGEDDEKERMIGEVKRQIDLLRTDYLDRLGFRNVLFQKGYEADDLIASACKVLPPDERAVIVSGDKDLYQLLSPTVSFWNPRSAVTQKAQGRITRKSFVEEYNGLKPEQWPDVKALAGCASDNVPGVFRVGETIASAYLCGRPVNSAAKRMIEEFMKGDQYAVNKQLVRLPYPGCKAVKLEDDEMDEGEWEKIVRELGMTSLSARDF